MGRLSGFSYREITARLKGFGFARKRQAAGSHEIWGDKVSRRAVSIPRHSGDMPEGTLRAILKAAGITPDQFLGGNRRKGGERTDL